MIETLWQRIQDKGLRAWSSDNVAEVIESEEERWQLIDELAVRFNSVLDGLLIDYENDPNAMETGRRLAKMYVLETISGRYNPPPKVTAFPNEGTDRYDGMLVVRSEITSMCSHHHSVVRGVCYTGILPADNVIGLSKYSRIIQHLALRPTLQEMLCTNIADAMVEATGSKSVGVYIQAEHNCCTVRGIKANSSLTQTTVLRGEFHNADVKKEFFDNIALQVATNK